MVGALNYLLNESIICSLFHLHSLVLPAIRKLYYRNITLPTSVLDVTSKI